MGVLVWVCGWVFLSWCTGMDFGVEVFGRVGFWDVLRSVLETREGLLLVPGEF